MRKNHFFLLLFLPLFFACANQTENAAPAPTETNETVETNATNQNNELGMITNISKGKITLKDGKTVDVPGYLDPNAIIFYCVRHCEKAKDGTQDPPLTPEGLARAERLGTLLEGEPIRRICTTNFKRTIQTGEKVSPHVLAATLETYPPEVQADWVEEVLTNDKGGTFVIVGHQNTIPELLNHLTRSTAYKWLPDDEFGRIFIVTSYGLGKTQVLQGKY